MVTGLPLSSDEYMANWEWGFLMPMSACTNRVEEKRPFHLKYSAYYYSLPMASASLLPFSVTREWMR